MLSSVITARLEFGCGHFALVSLPRLKGETASQRTERVNKEKAQARSRACDFCAPSEQALFELDGHQHAGEKEENVMTETPSVTRLGAEETQRSFPPRRRLNDEQEREVTRLYVETKMPVPDISKQFSIGESSVYRIAQRHGAGLRGRGASSSTSTAASTPTRTRRTRRATATTAAVTPLAEVSAPGGESTIRRRRRAPRAAAPQSGSAQPAPTRRRRGRAATGQTTPAVKSTRRGRRSSAANGSERYEIQFRVETVVRAADVRAALRQVEALGATDVIAIVRQDR